MIHIASEDEKGVGNFPEIAKDVKEIYTTIRLSDSHCIGTAEVFVQLPSAHIDMLASMLSLHAQKKTYKWLKNYIQFGSIILLV